MSVSASLEPERLEVDPGELSSMSLHLHNTSDEPATVSLTAVGDLADHTVLSTGTVTLEADEHLEVPVVIDANDDLAHGQYECSIDLDVDGERSNISAAVQLGGAPQWSASLWPQRSSSSRQGKHEIHIDNPGADPLTLAVETSDPDGCDVETSTGSVTVEPGDSTVIGVRVVPHERLWNGDSVLHPFAVSLTGDGDGATLEGEFSQRCRLRPWIVPALAGLIGALALGVVAVALGAAAWFALLRPEVESIAEEVANEEAAELDEAQQAALDERVTSIEQAAADAARLPLGQPTDLRITVAASPATTSTEAFVFDEAGTGRVLSISDVIFQNPTGAIGRVELLRDDEVLLDQEMANFRDLDFHLVAPLQVDGQSTISLRVTCNTPGPGTEACEASATIVGFVDRP